MNGHKNVRRYGDQYHCSECCRQWDINDPEPPQCRRDSGEVGRQAIDGMRKLFSKTTLQSDK